MNTDKCRFEGRQNLSMQGLRLALAAEVLKLEKLVPGLGLAFVFKDYEGKAYLFANKDLPIPKDKKMKGIQGVEAIVTLENGNRFSVIRFVVQGLSPDFGLVERIDLACAAITAIANLDQRGAALQAA